MFYQIEYVLTGSTFTSAYSAMICFPGKGSICGKICFGVFLQVSSLVKSSSSNLASVFANGAVKQHHKEQKGSSEMTFYSYCDIDLCNLWLPLYVSYYCERWSLPFLLWIQITSTCTWDFTGDNTCM